MENELFEELERTCKRTQKELHDMNDRLEQNKTILSPQDLDSLFKLSDIIKDTLSSKKKLIEIEEMENNNFNQNEYSRGYSGRYMTQPMWDMNNGMYSGNSYHGTYTMNTGGRMNDNYSGRMNDNYSGRHNYSYGMQNDDINSKLEMAMKNARDNSEMEAIRKAMEIANR